MVITIVNLIKSIVYSKTFLIIFSGILTLLILGFILTFIRLSITWVSILHNNKDGNIISFGIGIIMALFLSLYIIIANIVRCIIDPLITSYDKTLLNNIISNNKVEDDNNERVDT